MRDTRSVLFAVALTATSCRGVLPATGSETDTSTTTSATTSATTSGDPTSAPETSTGPSPTTTTLTETTGSESSETVGFLFDVGGVIDLSDGTTGDTGIVIDWDCDDLVQPFESETELGSPRGYHDVYFDDDGHILGWDGNAILAVTYDDQVSVFLPGVNSAQGMDKLENGDLLYNTDFGELRRVTPDLQSSTVATGLDGAYGITVGPDQLAYVSTYSQVVRVDPESGDQAPWVVLPGGTQPRALVFNLDSTGAFISTLASGEVFFVEVDADLDPAAEPSLFATGVGEGYHDGLGIDACGNLYVPDYYTSGLYRVDPEGVVTTLFNDFGAGQNHYGHGLEWGSGIDGWDDHAIYLPQPYDSNTVLEVVLGVPSGSLVRTWNR